MARVRTEHAATAMQQLVDLLAKRVAASTRNPSQGKFTYIIGNNGTGKSRALGALAERLAKTRSERPVACIASSIHDRFTYGDHGRVRYLGSRNQTNAVFLAAFDRQLLRLILQAMTIDRRSAKVLCETVNMDLAFRIPHNFESQVKDLLKLPSESSKQRRTKAFALRGLSSARPLSVLRRLAAGTGQFDRLTLVQVQTLSKYIELGLDVQLDVVLGDQTRWNFRELSTGEQNRLLVLAKVLSVMKEGAVFLIDEPEVSLHLHWQMRFHETLLALLSKLDRFHVVVATHAPVVISEAAKHDPDKRRNVVAILRHAVDDGERPADVAPGSRKVTLETHRFSDVASHDQLVLRYFQSAPYHAREVSVEIADAVLRGAKRSDASSKAVELLEDLRRVEGLSDTSLAQIDEAIDILKRGWLKDSTGGRTE